MIDWDLLEFGDLAGVGLTFEIVLYGDAECTDELGRTRTAIPLSMMGDAIVGGRTILIYTKPIAKNKPVYAKCACSSAGESITISILYKEL